MAAAIVVVLNVISSSNFAAPWKDQPIRWTRFSTKPSVVIEHAVVIAPAIMKGRRRPQGIRD